MTFFLSLTLNEIASIQLRKKERKSRITLKEGRPLGRGISLVRRWECGPSFAHWRSPPPFPFLIPYPIESGGRGERESINIISKGVRGL